MKKTFSEKLEEMGVEFGDEKYRMLSFVTTKRIMVRMEKCSPLKELINTVCQELAQAIEDEFISGEISFSDIEYMGFSEVILNINRKGSDDNSSIIVECDIWESKS